MADNVNNIWDKDQITPDYAGNELHVALQENALASTDEQTVYYGRVVKMDSIGKDTIVHDLVTIGQDEGLGTDALLRVWNILDAAVIDRVKRGYFVSTGLCNVRLAVKGTFASKSETFDPEKHCVRPVLIASDELKTSLADSRVEIFQGNTTAPEITAIRNCETGEGNTATSGGLLEITGSNIRVVGDDDSVGVYFVSEADNSEHKVDETKIAVNSKNRVTVIVPELSAGSYRLRITTRYMGSADIYKRESRSAVWGEVVTVL